jgi:hypothetical protein
METGNIFGRREVPEPDHALWQATGCPDVFICRLDRIIHFSVCLDSPIGSRKDKWVENPGITAERFLFMIDHIRGKWYLDDVSKQDSASTTDFAAGLQRLASDKHKVWTIKEKSICRNR